MASCCRSSASTHRPSVAMPTGTTSYRSGSSAAITLPAETQEMACSALRPPNTTATRTLPACPFIASTLAAGCAAPRRPAGAGAVWQPRRVQEQAAPPVETFSRRQRLAGAAVHLYTASGSVLGLLIVLAALEGEVETALWLGLATLFVDGTDGMLARRFRVKETIPWF